MAIECTIRAVGDLVQLYGEAIIEAAVTHGSRRILCHETELAHRLGTVDTFLAARHVAERAVRVVRVALVCAPRSMGDARFWEDVTRNRELQAAVFDDADAARRWLDDRPPPEP